MQKIFLEKNIDLNGELKELMALSVDESINYKMENEGIRAVGSLMIQGEYKADELMVFEDSIDLDVLATFDKIIDQRDFSIKVEDFDYHVQNGNLFVKVEAGVHGVIQGEDRYVEESSIDEIESLIRDEFKEEIEQVIESVYSEEPLECVREEVEELLEEELFDTTDVLVVDTSEELKENIGDDLKEVVYATKSRPIFQDTSDSVGTYYLYIVKQEDTYDSIAMYYNVPRDVLVEYNQSKLLEPGSVLIVPYVV